MLSEDMDSGMSSFSQLVGSPDPHSFAYVILYSGASYPSAWADQRNLVCVVVVVILVMP